MMWRRPSLADYTHPFWRPQVSHPKCCHYNTLNAEILTLLPVYCEVLTVNVCRPAILIPTTKYIHRTDVAGVCPGRNILVITSVHAYFVQKYLCFCIILFIPHWNTCSVARSMQFAESIQYYLGGTYVCSSILTVHTCICSCIYVRGLLFYAVMCTYVHTYLYVCRLPV